MNHLIMNIKVMSFNCGGFNPQKGLHSVKNMKINQIQAKCDILLLQETWLTKQETKLLPGSIPGFIGTGVATVDASDGLITSHPPGGVAIFYRNNLSSYVSIIDTKLDWVTGIQFCKNNISIYIFPYTYLVVITKMKIIIY